MRLPRFGASTKPCSLSSFARSSSPLFRLRNKVWLQGYTPILNLLYLEITSRSQQRAPVGLGIHAGASMATTVRDPARSSIHSSTCWLENRQAVNSATRQPSAPFFSAQSPVPAFSPHARSTPIALSD